MNGLKRLSFKERRLPRFSSGYSRPLSCSFHQKRFISSSQKQKSTTHYYDVLGVTRQATAQQIKSAYYKLSKEYHPDVNKNTGANKMFVEISEAYEILGKESSRVEYDNRYQQSAHPNWDGKSSPFGPKPGFKPRKAGTSYGTGRSPIYNFDEHYRKHYEELLVRNRNRMQEKQRQYEAYTRSKNKQQHYGGVGSKKEDIASAVAVYIVVLSIAAVLFKTGIR